MRFLFEAFRRHRHRLRLEQFLLLALRCLILVVLGLALSGMLLSGGIGVGAVQIGAGRLLCLVVDDSLTSRVEAGRGERRIDRLRGAAEALIGALGPADRVALWKASRPAEALIVPPTSDHQAVIRAVRELEGAFGRADVPAALGLVKTTLESDETLPEQVVVAVISDWARGALGSAARPDAQISTLADRGRFILSRPMAAVDNVQIESVRPLRRVVLGEEDGSVSIPLQAVVRRFSTDASGSGAQVSWSIVNEGAGQVLDSRRVSFSAGERVAAPLNVTLQLGPDLLPQDAAGRSIVIRTAVLADQGDLLADDDSRQVVISWRRRLVVALIDGPASVSQGVVPASGWLTAALAPNGQRDARAEQLSIVPIAAPGLDEADLGAADAAMFMRPDLLERADWAAVRRYVEAGGLAVLFAPDVPAQAEWSAHVQAVMDLDWQLSVEPQEAEGEPWALALTDPVPEVFDQLAPDWLALLGPVRVHRRLPFATGNSASLVWLRVRDRSEDPLLAAARIGDGALVLLAVALDPEWSNLTTKPIWPPLVHEMIRGSVGLWGEAARYASLTAPAAPVFGRRWRRVQHLVPLTATAPDETSSIALVVEDQRRRPARLLDKPGVYAGRPGPAPILCVNVDADAGNTEALESQQVGAWFSSLGRWQWMDWSAPAAVMQSKVPAADLTWPLLWLTLGLILLEAFVARWFSHASIDAGKRAGAWWRPWGRTKAA